MEAVPAADGGGTRVRITVPRQVPSAGRGSRLSD